MALVGASARPGSLGARMIDEVARSPSRPRTYLVNPRYADIGGVPCLPDLAAVPEPVDLVLLARARPRARAAAVRRGAKPGPFGRYLRQRLRPPGRTGLRRRLAAIAGQAGMAVCGAGCMGFVNVARGLRAIGYVEPDPLPAGPVALVTHSGSVFSALLRTRRGFGFSLAVSSGQELVTTAADYARYALELAETKVLALVLEAIRDAAGLRAVLADALAADVPVVLLSVGASQAGQAMVSAHSGALAAADGAWEALAGAYGLHRVRDLAELADTLELFAAGRPRRAPAPGIATVHDSGLERAHAADLAAELGVPFAALAPADAHPAGRGARPGPGPGQPAGRVGDRPGHRAAVRRVPVRAGRRPGRGRGRAGRRPGARVRRRRVLPAGGARPRPRARPSRSRCWPGCRPPSTRPPRPGCAPPGSRCSRAPAPACSRCATCSTTPAARHPRPPGYPGRAARAKRPAPGRRRPRCSTCCATTASRRCAPGPPRPGRGPGGRGRDRLPGRAQDRRAGHRAQVRRRRGPARPGRPGRGRRRLRRPGRAAWARGCVVCETAAPGTELALGVVRDPALGPLLVIGAGGVLVEIMAERAVLLAPVTRSAGLAALAQAPDRPGAGREPRPARRRPRRDRRRHHRPVPPGLRPGRRPRGPRHQPAHLHPLRRP